MFKNKKRLIILFTTFLKIGLFSFGGGFAMIPLMEKEIVDKHQWIEKDKFLDAISITQSVPGAVAVNLSIFFGYNTAGFLGAIISAIAVSLPSFSIILMIAFGFKSFSEYQIVNNIFRGIRPAVVGLIFYAGINLARQINWSYSMMVMFAIVILSSVFLGFNPIFLIILAITVGSLRFFSNIINDKTGKESELAINTD
ncbi:MAG: chromate transporter [Halanaerobiales bacterium]